MESITKVLLAHNKMEQYLNQLKDWYVLKTSNMM